MVEVIYSSREIKFGGIIWRRHYPADGDIHESGYGLYKTFSRMIVLATSELGEAENKLKLIFLE
jgi:hypothetical protein